MKTYNVELSARAEADIRGAYDYICEHGPANPDAWKAGLDQKLAFLETFPTTCPIAPESAYRQPTIRHLLYGPFRILFAIRGNVVHVITVRHGARRFLSREELDEAE